MAAMKATMTTMLLFVFHVASSCGLTIMDPRDKSTLMAVKASFEKKEKFPQIKCSVIQCDKAGRVTALYLVGLGLQGRIAPEIGNLTKLQELDLGENELIGSIPSSIGNLESLITLDLSYNHLSGIIPSSIGNLKSLSDLRLYDNLLSGSIPSSIGKLKSLKSLDVYKNQLSGSIPTSIGNLKSLVQLYLDKNRLSGSIPFSIGNLKSLEELTISENQLSGRIPSSFVNLKSLNLFLISNNYLTGPILQVNEHPLCYELKANCLFGSNLPKGCGAGAQRSKSVCLSFCNATQVGGPCGGKGICSIGTDGKTSICACNKGFNNKARKYTCK